MLIILFNWENVYECSNNNNIEFGEKKHLILSIFPNISQLMGHDMESFPRFDYCFFFIEKMSQTFLVAPPPKPLPLCTRVWLIISIVQCQIQVWIAVSFDWFRERHTFMSGFVISTYNILRYKLTNLLNYFRYLIYFIKISQIVQLY